MGGKFKNILPPPAVDTMRHNQLMAEKLILPMIIL
jgi:hypothetical protein